MAAKGYITAARANRRKLAWLVAGYVLAIELLAIPVLSFVLAFVDPAHAPYRDPAAYALFYMGPVALLGGAMFALLYRGHVREVVRRLGIVMVASGRGADPQAQRLVRIAEPVATIAGIRRLDIGLIDAPEPNALSAGASSSGGLIAVTRGLLDLLDDDEVAAVIAHQAAHIRGGDTQIAAANFALMRTAVHWQVNNPLRIEDWRQAFIVLALPFFLPVLLFGSALTMMAMRLAYAARRGIALSRDAIADGEAVRITHFPEALVSAIEKTAGRGQFADAAILRGLLFCNGHDSDKVLRALVKDRIDAIVVLGRSMIGEPRLRADTRPPRRLFGQPAAPAAPPATQSREQAGPPVVPPLHWLITDPAAYRKLYKEFVDASEWREGEGRNMLGLTPKGLLPLGFVMAVLIGLHWPTDGDYMGSLQLLNPAAVPTMIEGTQGTFSSSKGPDGQMKQTGDIQVFTGVSPDSLRKQGYLLMIITLGLGIAAQIPGLKEHLGAGAGKRVRKSAAREAIGNAVGSRLVSQPPPRGRQPDFTEWLERELAALREPGAPAAVREAISPEPLVETIRAEPRPMPSFGTARSGFGRKIG